MFKSFRYRLYPIRKQARVLQTQLEECRWLYNHFLEARKQQWDKHKKSLDDRGSLAVGKLADLVVLSRDILDESERDRLADTRVLTTVVGGRIVYQRNK